jgi:DNA-binding transcriptional ArsR family regulator
LSDDEKMRDLYGYLIQAMLFSDIGISTKMLLELTDVTRSTLAKRLKTIDDAGLLITEKRGTEQFYMTDVKKIEAMSVGE